MKPAPVGQPGAQQRAGPVQTQPERGDGTFHRRQHRGIVGEHDVGRLQNAPALHPYLVRPVDEHVRHRGIPEQRLDRTHTHQGVHHDIDDSRRCQR